MNKRLTQAADGVFGLFKNGEAFCREAGEARILRGIIRESIFAQKKT